MAQDAVARGRSTAGHMLHPRNTLLFSSLILACSTNNDLYPIRENPVGGRDAAGGAPSGGTPASSGGSGGTSTALGGRTATEGGTPPGEGGLTGSGGCGAGSDVDGDGYTVLDGDCNDCNAAQNPGAFDVPGNGVDDDCSGAPDDEITSCDDGLAESSDAVGAARALGLCRRTTSEAQGRDRTWGLISARFVFPDGSTTSLEADVNMECPSTQSAPNDASHGVLGDFGAEIGPREGAALTALSTGVARPGFHVAPGNFGLSPDGAAMCTRSLAPNGFPVKSYTTCGDQLGPNGSPVYDSIYDAIALELVIRAPTNAKSFGFDFDFYSYEYPNYVCYETNDAFAAFLFSKADGLVTGRNIATDADGNPVSINATFLDVCEPSDYFSTRSGAPFVRSFTCPLGTRELDDTGFAGELDGLPHAATGWLRTRSGVTPGEEITLRLAIWDAGEELYDSTVLLDDFSWDVASHETSTLRKSPD